MEDIGEAKTMTVHARPGDELLVKAKRNYKVDFKPFSMIGPVRRKTTRKVYMDIFDCLTKVSKSALILFNEIKLKSDKDLGMAIMANFEEYNKAKMSSIYRRLVELQKVNLVKKVIPYEASLEESEIVKSNKVIPEKYTYMINPYYIKPWKYELAKEIWEKI